MANRQFHVTRAASPGREFSASPQTARRQRPGVFPRLACVALGVWLVLGAATDGAAQAVQRQVLVLQSVNRGNMVLDTFTTNFHVELDHRADQPVNFVQIVVGPTGSVGAPEQAVVDFIRSTFVNGAKPDLIVAIAGPATVFARKYRQQLFPDTPLLFAAVDQRFLADAPLGENETAVVVAADFPGMIDEILQLLPQTRQIFIVTGAGQIGTFWRRELDKPLARFHDRVTFIWGDDLSLPEILRRSASLPDHSAILFMSFGTDAGGAAYADERVLGDLNATARAPVFGLQSTYLGAGVVGGSLMRIDELCSEDSRCGHSTVERRVAPERQLYRHNEPVSRCSIGASYSGGGFPRTGCRPGAWCAFARRVCGRNTAAPCSAPSACWPSNRS